eukprot:g3127.t1
MAAVEDEAAWYDNDDDDEEEEEVVPAAKKQRVDEKQKSGDSVLATEAAAASGATATSLDPATPGGEGGAGTADDQPELNLSAPTSEVASNNNWDVKCVVVRQGQLMLELQRREPPMTNDDLIRFSDWLSKQLPPIIQNFPYVRKSGCIVDLSDNIIGPQGLDRLLNVLRDHKVPCNTLKAYRNCLDDSIVDTLVEYFYTQPAGNAIQSIHMSHNRITDNGCARLLEAASKCEHYPRHVGEGIHPLWLRLECNAIVNPTKVVVDMGKEKNKICLMQDGQCSMPHCDHWNVHVQLPHFVNQDHLNEHRHYEHGEYDKTHAEGKKLLEDVFGSNRGTSTTTVGGASGGAGGAQPPSGAGEPAAQGGVAAGLNPRMKEELLLIAKGIQRGLIGKEKGQKAMVDLLQRAKGQGQQEQQGGSSSSQMPPPSMPAPNGLGSGGKGSSSGGDWKNSDMNTWGNSAGGKNQSWDTNYSYGRSTSSKGGYNSKGKSDEEGSGSYKGGKSFDYKGGKHGGGSFDKGWGTGGKDGWGKSDGGGGKYGGKNYGKQDHGGYQHSYGKDKDGKSGKQGWGYKGGKDDGGKGGKYKGADGGKTPYSGPQHHLQSGGQSSFDLQGKGSFDHQKGGYGGGKEHSHSSWGGGGGNKGGWGSSMNGSWGGGRDSAAPAAPAKPRQIDFTAKKDADLGFTYEIKEVDEIDTAIVTGVTAESEIGKKGLQEGMKIVRLNGMDVSMFSASQIKELLTEKKSLAIRFK